MLSGSSVFFCLILVSGHCWKRVELEAGSEERTGRSNRENNNFNGRLVKRAAMKMLTISVTQ